VENKTALTVLSKPVSRTTFVLGKYFGLAAAVSLAMYIAGLAFLFTVRHKVVQSAATPYDQPVWVFGALGALATLIVAALVNYLSGAHFPTAAITIGTPVLTAGFLLTGFWDAKWNLNEPYGKGIDLSLLAAMILIWQAVLLLSAIALLASTRLKQAATLAFTFAALLVGLWNDSFFGTKSGLASGIVPTTSQPTAAAWQLAASSPALPTVLHHDPAWLKGVYGVCYRTLPNFNFYWTSDAILQNVPIPFLYVGQVGVYTICYIAALLALGVVCFQTKEVS
jgi:ABC-2 type transport system permease protein